MAMGRRRARQQRLWIAASELPRTRGHVFYDRVNEILREEGFDVFAEAECLRFYKSEMMGRPSIAPGVYFRMLMVGYFEGIDSERGIAWRCRGLDESIFWIRTDPDDAGSLDRIANEAID
jgi:hypothetical protein